MRAEFFCHAVAEVLRAQHCRLADTVCGQPPLGVHPVDPDRGSVELLDPLPERPQDCPHDRGLFSRAGSDVDRQHARLTGRQRVDRPDGGDVVGAVDDHADRKAHRAVPSWKIALRAIVLSIRAAPSVRQIRLAVCVNAAQERSRPFAALSLISTSSWGSTAA
jgi:hypothetical protein